MALVEAIEQRWDADTLAECDKSWDAMHRCLTDGRLEDGSGAYPFSHVVLGPRQLHSGGDYIVSLVEPAEVRDVAAALSNVASEWFAERYRRLVPKNYSPNYGDQDLEYTWSWFENV